jgi:hypothetical protein
MHGDRKEMTMREIKNRKTGETLRWADATWDELTPAQKNDVMYGSACGHPSNRPKSEREASRWLYNLSPDKQAIQGITIGYIDMSGTYRSR